jgi:pimeloyl-ACP methyl ester carboxylesterase
MGQRSRLGWLAAIASTLACSDVELDPPQPIIHARFDPDEKVIPMPTDVLRDDDLGRLDLPNDDDDERDGLTSAELEFYSFLETLDGWSSLMSATVELTAPIDPASLDADSLQVWRWAGVPERIADVRVTLADDGKKITIDPPRTGWERGERYFVVLRGGARGLTGRQGEKVECDAAFYFLRQTERLDVEAHARAFPGLTRAERADNARKLEEIRVDLVDVFDWLEERQALPRQDVAALWAFTVTRRTELAMDKPSQRMPLPIGMLVDPDTGLVDIPVAEWDTPVEVEAKQRLRLYDGFATSANLLFEFTGPMDADSITPANIKMYRLGGAQPVPLDIDVELMKDLRHVKIMPKALPLPEASDFAVVVTRGVRDANGMSVVAMPVGHFLKAREPVWQDGGSRVKAVADDDARKVELTRRQLAPALDALGREDVVAAWSFTTQTVHAPLVDRANAPTRLAVPVDPENVEHVTPGEALADFLLGFASLLEVKDVYHGTIKSPVFLDRRTRAWREDGGHELEDIRFTMTVPRNLPAGPVPVVMFGHAIMTESRFLLAIGDQLARQGFVAVSIDFPYHGSRTHCISGGPISVVDPQTGELTSLPPCESGTTCNEEGRCVDAAGQGNKLAQWPALNYPIASGAAFLELEHIANTKDHFTQAVIDLRALERSLREGDWESVIGQPVDTSRIYYAGQSLGGIIGATYLATTPDVKRAVLNVAGADLVDMFDDSGWFSDQVDAFFIRENVERDSYEGERFLNVAKWIVDAVDPQNLGEAIGDRDLLLQMATLDFIIPNWSTKKLEEVTGAPRRDYLAEHAFIVIPIEPEYGRGSGDLAAYLAGKLNP